MTPQRSTVLASPSDLHHLCEICGSKTQPQWTVCDSQGVPWEYESCPCCQFIRILADTQDKCWNASAYPESYYGEGYSKFTGAIQALRRLSAWRRAREIHRKFERPGRVLDIGCGEGLFLRFMKSRGWEVQGCETGIRAAERAEANLGQPIFHGDFFQMPPTGRPWDIVFVWHVLEHLPHPLHFLEKMREITSSQSLLVLAIPNADSWQARIFGPHWFHLDPPRHLTQMGLRHLRELATRSGWTIESTHHFSLEYNPFGWAQSFLNAMGWKRDAMYETLKNRQTLGIQSWTLRVLAWTLLGPSILPAIFEAVARRGGCICCYLVPTNRVNAERN